MGVEVKDVFGNFIKCRGGWNDPKNVDQMLSAVTTVHNARLQEGYTSTYSNACVECCKLLNEHQDKSGCPFHCYKPIHWRTGNPKTSTIIKNALHRNSKEGASYVAHGDSPLTPWELMSFRTYLLATNNLYDFSTWLMTLVSVKLFLRESEAATIKIEDFVNDLNVLNEGGTISGVAVTVDVCLSIFQV